MINFLLDKANPSIKRRIHTEILHNLNAEDAADYQEQIRILTVGSEQGQKGAR